MGIVGAALLAIGGVLAFSGANIPLGIALIAAGAVTLVTVTALAWNDLPSDVKASISSILAIVGAATIVLGIILCVTGVGIPLGIALILAGVTSLVTAAAINWDFLKTKIADVWKGIVAWFKQNVAPIFTADWWANLFKSIANGLISILNGALGLADNFVNSILGGLANIAGTFGIDLQYTPQTSMRIPYLAQGAVIPPNRKFAAVLGDQRNGRNLEAPESLIRQIVREESGGLDASTLQQVIAMAISQTTQQSGGDVTLVLRVGNEELAQAVSRGNASLARRGVLKPEFAI